ncbi:MAG: hypothetical protein H0U74_17795 [Bradymonadaceae bacterium]|nr:hypothetical protein [Lujinxingiaceae bacterium]
MPMSSIRTAAFAALPLALMLAVASPAFAQTEATAKESCLASNIAVKDDLEMAARWNERVKSRPIAQIAVHAGFLMGGGLNGSFSSDPDSGLGYGWSLAARTEVMLLNPLWISGRARYFGGNGHSIHLDAMAGLNLRDYEQRWIKAGQSSTTTGSTTISSSWNSHCQLRRSDFQLLGGTKIIATGGEAVGDSENVLALQAGVQSMYNNGKIGSWALTGLFEPFSTAYGGQLTMGVGGIYGSPNWLYTDFIFGFLLGGQSAFWMTIDFGAIFEI